MVEKRCLRAGIKAEMIYTGQTGWLQGYKYGFIFDATLNDFVSAELENAIVRCSRNAGPDLILIEGSRPAQPVRSAGRKLWFPVMSKG